MSDLIIASALSELRSIVASEVEASPVEISQQLRVLQRRGLSKLDLVVHLERLRAQNDIGERGAQTEDNVILALEIVGGMTRVGLVWDAVQTAAAWVPLAVSAENLASAAIFALAASDLLPARPPFVDEELRQRFVSEEWRQLTNHGYEPTHADFFRAPKNGLTTRPAALLAPDDRLIFESLVQEVASVAPTALPKHVIWPRGRAVTGTYSDFASAPETWNSEFVLRTDISSFYESVDHGYLCVILGRHMSLRGAFPVALEAFLDAITQATVGLPQGPLGSDILASSYLIDIDHAMERNGWPVARYSDDILIGANSFDEARSRLRELETLLRGRGLSLANEKTRIVRRRTYLSTLGRDGAYESLRTRLLPRVAEWFEQNPDPRFEGVVDAIELPDQTQWDVLYHESMSWEEALAQVDEHALPPWIRAYEWAFREESRRLDSGGYGDDKQALSPQELRRCLLFMSADPQAEDLAFAHAIIDWHPTLVREMSKYLEVAAAHYPEAVTRFVEKRLSLARDSDVEMAWLLAPAIENSRLARLLRKRLAEALADTLRPVSAAMALRALSNSGALSRKLREATIRSFSPALRAELALSLEWPETSGWQLIRELSPPDDSTQ